MSKRTKTIIYSLIALIIVALVLWPIVSHSSGSKENKGKKGSGRPTGPVEVKGKVLDYDSFSSEIKVMGNVLADDWVDLSPEVAGKIIQINFKEGTVVSKGQLLVKINDADLKAQLKKSEAKLHLSKLNLDRQEKLLAAQSTTKEEYDAAVYDHSSILADIDLLKAQIQKTEIRAPFSGKIGLRYLSQGAYVSPGTKIATLQNTSKLKIDFVVPQNYSIYIKNGNFVTFTSGNADDTARAQIYAVEPGVDATSATLRVRAYITTKTTHFVPGKMIEVLVPLSAPVRTILIPSETLVPEISGYSVFLYKSGIATSVKVEVGDRTEKVVQIISGINRGDTLIVSGLIQLGKNTPVKLSGFAQ